MIPARMGELYDTPVDAHKHHYLCAAIHDCVPLLEAALHLPTPQPLLAALETEVDSALDQHILQRLCQDIEKDLRLSIHHHLQLDERNPFKEGVRPLSNFLKIRPLLFFHRRIDIKAHVTHYLDTTFYNLTTVALHDWKTYGDMRNLAQQ
eukprot:Colp12_sorted_trinity150504_noHs@17166